LSKVLTEILNQVAPGKLAYAVDDGVINISTIDELNKKTVIKVYDIHDLLINPQFNGQIMGGNLSFSNSGTGGGSGASSQIFSQSQTQQGGTGTGPNGTGSQQLTDIENKIKSTVDFSSWKTNDPNGNGTIDDFNSELIISQTSDVHDDIGNLLAKLREARSIEVTVEVRFLTVNRNFLEDVGLTLNFTSIGLGNNNFAPISLTNQTAQWTQAPTTGVPGTIGDNEPVGMNLSTGYTSGGILDNLQVSLLLRAVQASKTGSIVHAPRVTLTNGQSATLQEQTLIPYVASLTASVAAGAVIAVPVIADATDGVSLNILGAVVSADHKYVTLDLNPVLDQFGGFDTFTFETATSTAGSSGLIAPTAAPTLTIQEPIETVTQVRTRVTVPDGGTLLLGGLTVAGEVEEEAGVPVLSKIPFLQRLSTNKSMAKDENILIMLVKPTIIIDKEIEAKNFPILSANGHQ
jgi:general secretion pathway protein D